MWLNATEIYKKTIDKRLFALIKSDNIINMLIILLKYFKLYFSKNILLF